ncbi:DUF2075 domain-containing protein [Natronospirillum operosum]|uniref:DUF2075 domain-containing protein n=1 Tax=Natronospirillum operosum TaxID=2759953 RepID=A0A4Z0WG87_9GAMM|nr:DNA/RNA helicase domain-containing protein [Natronospirillum operosum]TGG93588.1 DUF2075 domain-containing protein [Natronospirillum operosum]
MTEQRHVEVRRYPFSRQSLDLISDDHYASNQWPLVYILSDDASKRAYIGETTDTLTRLRTHLKNDKKQSLTVAHLISSERFNKSATLDIESTLIKYMGADGNYQLLNGNLGLVDHNYYQKDELYADIFRETWDKLRGAGVTIHSLDSIDNSDVFKYSPYKSLSFDQRQGLLGIMYTLLSDDCQNLIVEGGAGTGKSVLAIFLFKLLNSDTEELDLRDFSDEEAELRDLLKQLKEKYPKPDMALVVPMSSFRQTLKKAFRNIAGLSANMVIGPAELANKKYDIVLVDESHRLRKRTNLGAYYGTFDKVCGKLQLDKHSCSELDWVLFQSDKAVFFYDENQSIKPSDANPSDFSHLKAAESTQVQTLLSQFRVRAGNAYTKFVDDLLHQQLEPGQQFRSKKYEFEIFDNIQDMADHINERERQHGLSRLIAGFAWPWISKNDDTLFDIEIGDKKLRWNRTTADWINTTGAENEVGCIHTTQGYDLNYAGIIFGEEIRYDREHDEIIIDQDKYFDRNGKQSIRAPAELKQYILNIYKTIMLRGIHGTFVYACDSNLRDYLKRHIPTHINDADTKSSKVEKLEPYVNAVPVYNIQAAAGSFGELQQVNQEDWAAVPPGTRLTEDYFACRVVGESMNRIIPNGALCLFRKERGGSRNGKIVLVEFSDTIDADSGSRYTVKEYVSTKIEDETGWQHQRILLKPRSFSAEFNTIEVSDDADVHFRVVGEFLSLLE